MIIRLLGIGLKEYLSDYFNIVDAFIVCVSIADIIISYSTPGDSRRLLLTGFRSIRILRILKLARSWASFRILLAQVIRSLKDIITFTVIMTIFIIIFMVLGMQIFAYTVFFNKDGEIVATAEEGDPPEVNFENIFNAFVTVFTILIGDNWNNIMYEF
jgi:voltage-dependent calcium channel L type alpha-1D